MLTPRKRCPETFFKCEDLGTHDWSTTLLNWSIVNIIFLIPSRCWNRNSPVELEGAFMEILSEGVRAGFGESDVCVPVQNVYVSIRQTANHKFYRFAGFEDSTDGSLQNLYGDFTQRQTRTILLKLGMTEPQTQETLAKVMESTSVHRFRLELTSRQSTFLRLTLGSGRNLSGIVTQIMLSGGGRSTT